MRNNIIYLSLLTLGCMTSCSGFLEENSQNMAYVETISDLDELLVGEVYFGQDANNGHDPKSGYPTFGNWPAVASERFLSHFLMDDDIEEFVTGTENDSNTSGKNWMRYSAAATFYWQPYPYKDHEGIPYKVNTWSNYYKRIATANSILFQLEEMHAEGDTLNPRVEGETRFLRAAYYLMLINTYAQPYSKATASTEPGVPLKTSEIIEDRFFARASVAEVYGRIVKDLERAIVCLKKVSLFPRPIRTNYAAAATLLSRVYLYMEEYEKTITYADEAIGHPNFGLLDLNNHPKEKSFASLKSPETLFSQRGTIVSLIHQNDSMRNSYYWLPGFKIGNGYATSQDLLNCFDETDLRKNAFFEPMYYNKDTYRCLKVRELSDDVVGEDHIIRLPEAYLNKAEAQAALGYNEEARTTLRILLEKRFTTANVPEITASGADLVNYIREERRRELCYEGHRWFDLRRYAVNSKFPFTKSIEHVSYEYIKSSVSEGFFRKVGKYVLKPYPEDKAAYVLPLPDYAVLFNEGMLEQNPERPARSLLPLE